MLASERFPEFIAFGLFLPEFWVFGFELPNV